MCVPTKGKVQQLRSDPRRREGVDGVNRGSLGWHYFGIATNAAGLFNRQLKKENNARPEFGGAIGLIRFAFAASTRPIAQAFAPDAGNPTDSATAQRGQVAQAQPAAFGHVPLHAFGCGPAVAAAMRSPPTALLEDRKGHLRHLDLRQQLPRSCPRDSRKHELRSGTKKQVGYDHELFSLPGSTPEKLVGSINLWDVTKLSGKVRVSVLRVQRRPLSTWQPVVTETP